MKTEIGVMHLPAKKHQGCWQPRGASMEAWDGFSLRTSRRSQPCQHLDFELLASRTVTQYIYVVLSHLICGTLLWELQLSNTDGQAGSVSFPGPSWVFFNYYFYLFIYLFIGCTLWHVRSQFPDQGLNPCPLQWKHRVPTTGPSGKSQPSLVLSSREGRPKLESRKQAIFTGGHMFIRREKRLHCEQLCTAYLHWLGRRKG